MTKKLSSTEKKKRKEDRAAAKAAQKAPAEESESEPPPSPTPKARGKGKGKAQAGPSTGVPAAVSDAAKKSKGKGKTQAAGPSAADDPILGDLTATLGDDTANPRPPAPARQDEAGSSRAPIAKAMRPKPRPKKKAAAAPAAPAQAPAQPVPDEEQGSPMDARPTTPQPTPQQLLPSSSIPSTPSAPTPAPAARAGKRKAEVVLAEPNKKTKLDPPATVKKQMGIVVAMYGALGQLLLRCSTLFDDYEEEDGSMATPAFVLELREKGVYPLWDTNPPAGSEFTPEEHANMRAELIGVDRDIITWVHKTARGFDWSQAPEFERLMIKASKENWDLTHSARFTELVKKSEVGDPLELFMSDAFQMQDAANARVPPGQHHYGRVKQDILIDLYRSSISSSWMSGNAELLFSMLFDRQTDALKARASRALKKAHERWNDFFAFFPKKPAGEVLVGADIAAAKLSSAAKAAVAFLRGMGMVPVEDRDRFKLREIDVTTKAQLAQHLAGFLPEVKTKKVSDENAKAAWGWKTEVAGRTLGYLSVVAEFKGHESLEPAEEMARLAYLRGRAGATAWGVDPEMVRNLDPAVFDEIAGSIWDASQEVAVDHSNAAATTLFSGELDATAALMAGFDNGAHAKFQDWNVDQLIAYCGGWPYFLRKHWARDPRQYQLGTGDVEIPGITTVLVPHWHQAVMWAGFSRVLAQPAPEKTEAATEAQSSSTTAPDADTGGRKLRSINGKQSVPIGPSLVVVPNSLVQQWVTSCQSHFNEQVRVIAMPTAQRMWKDAMAKIPKEGNTTVVVISYTTLRGMHDLISRPSRLPFQNGEPLRSTVYSRFWTTVVLDESHSARKTGRVFSACQALLLVAFIKLLMTGTPVIESPRDVFNQLRLLRPSTGPQHILDRCERLLAGSARLQARERLKNQQSRLELQQSALTAGVEGLKHNADMGASMAALKHVMSLQRNLLGNHVLVRDMASLRTIKKTVGVGLPELEQLTIVTPSHADEIEWGDKVLIQQGTAAVALKGAGEGKQSFYLEARKVTSFAEAAVGRVVETSGVNAFWNKEDARFSKVTAIALLLERILDSGAQSVVGTLALKRDVVRMQELGFPPADHPQAAQFLGTLSQAQRSKPVTEKVIIFTYFAMYMEYVQAFLEHVGFRVLAINGSVTKTVKARQAVIDRFRDGDYHVLLATYNVASVGLELQMANVIIAADVDWSAISQAQTLGRVYRQGQEKKCFFFQLVAEHTIDFVLAAISLRKSSLLHDFTTPERTAAWEKLHLALESQQQDEHNEETAPNGPVWQALTQDLEAARTFLGRHKINVSFDGKRASRAPPKSNEMVVDGEDTPTVLTAPVYSSTSWAILAPPNDPAPSTTDPDVED
ncbi:unnamed protein product [Mycena citricolor]|uniref:Uncharacterized protein n=1 Tax=Mycena citricolor TaxID=2018698 RepID=A0AAD2HUE6_9AGAR|nr:unnamed protein product [Mycena citricolor]